MKTSEAKLKCIQEAYGDVWTNVKDFIDEHGCVDGIHPIKAGWSDEYDWNMKLWRPTSLRGIHDNNGWTRCDEEMPPKEALYMVCIDNSPQHMCVRLDYITQQTKIGLINVTHWKILPEQKPPVY